jgi:hypothetical protein
MHEQPRFRERSHALPALALALATTCFACSQVPGTTEPDGMVFTEQSPEHAIGTLRRGEQALRFEWRQSEAAAGLAISRLDGTPLVTWQITEQTISTSLLGGRLKADAPRAQAMKRVHREDRSTPGTDVRLVGDQAAWRELSASPEYGLVTEIEKQLAGPWYALQDNWWCASCR